MGFRHRISHIGASFLLVTKRTLFLAFQPYKTMRSISQHTQTTELGIIYLFIAAYFHWAHMVRPFFYPPLFLFFLVGVITYLSVVFYSRLAAIIGSKQTDLMPYVNTLSYAFVPTLLWFTGNSFLYVILPPPRTLSANGKLFSIVFVTLSVSMLLWKVMVWYLALRFSTRFKATRVIYLMLLYLCLLMPYMVGMYYLGVFRVPFV